MALLYVIESADFAFLMNQTGLTCRRGGQDATA